MVLLLLMALWPFLIPAIVLFLHFPCDDFLVSASKCNQHKATLLLELLSMVPGPLFFWNLMVDRQSHNEHVLYVTWIIYSEKYMST